MRDIEDKNPAEGLETILKKFSLGMNSFLVKFMLAGLMTLILLIPAKMTKTLINERSERMKKTVSEISSKWGAPELLAGPLLLIPQEKPADSTGKDKKPSWGQACFLPELFNAETTLVPEIRHRGIYETVVFKAKTLVKGHFNKPEIASLGLGENELRTADAILAVGLSNISTISGKVSFRVAEKELELRPGTEHCTFLGLGFHVRIPAELLAQGFDFSLEMELNGYDSFQVAPAGRESRSSISSTWPDPSFTGAKLPENRSVEKSGFKAEWISQGVINREFSQAWLGDADAKKFLGSASGARLLVLADAYQQTERSVKYAALFIALTFASLLVAERVLKIWAHPVQYFLVGGALVIFNCLLLSLSEQMGFGLAYLAASAAVVLLIAFYTKAVFRGFKPAFWIGTVVAALYAYIYVLLRMEDYSLLLGSIGLFIALASLMFFTRGLNAPDEPPEQGEHPHTAP